MKASEPTLADYARIVRITLFYYFEGADQALKGLGDRDHAQFQSFALGYQGSARQPRISEPDVLRRVTFESSHPDFRGLACTILTDLVVPRVFWAEILETLTGQPEPLEPFGGPC